MVSVGQFYENYDSLIPKICEPYYKFLSVAADAIPKNTNSICELGIGTGNFSLEVKKRIPDVTIYGIDLNESTLEIARKKINGLKAYKRELFSAPLPLVDYVISSLTTHHFDSETRREKLIQIAKSARKGFINFDIMLFDNSSLDDVIGLTLSFAKKYFLDRSMLEKIGREMKAHDNPMSLEEQKNLFESLGMTFRVLARQAPFAVYCASWPEKKE